MLESGRRDVSITRQCELIDLPRSTAYYKSHRDPTRVSDEIDIMNKIDELYTEHPNLGRIGMSDALRQRYGRIVNPKRTRRLMKRLGLAAVYPRPRKNTSMACKKA